MKKTLIAAIALFSMTACNVQVIETPSADEYGYINLGIAAETEMVVTKADLTTEDLANYSIELKKDGNNVEGWPKTYSSITADDWKVAAGTYTVVATNIDAENAYKNEDGSNTYGKVRVSGESDVTVTAGSTTNCTISCIPINSKVSFKYTARFDNVFDITSLTITNGSRAINMTNDAKLETSLDGNNTGLAAAYYEAETSLTWNLSVSKANNTTKTYEGSLTTKADKWSIVTFSVNSENGEIGIEVLVDGEITDVIDVPAELDPFEDEK